jgi:hypothetical protein
MLDMLISIIAALECTLRTRASLQLEILALRCLICLVLAISVLEFTSGAPMRGATAKSTTESFTICSRKDPIPEKLRRNTNSSQHTHRQFDPDCLFSKDKWHWNVSEASLERELALASAGFAWTYPKSSPSTIPPAVADHIDKPDAGMTR